MNAPRLALFDLDGTLLSGDTDELWCEFLIDEGRLDRATFDVRNRGIGERYAAGAISPADYCAFYAALLSGRSAAQWQPLRERFVTERIEPRLPASAHALLRCHRDAGDEIVLTTATNRFLTEPIAQALGIATLIATELEQIGGVFTGRNSGVLNMRAGKVERALAWLRETGHDPARLAAATFYSDSINDLPLLAAVAEPVVVDPDDTLLAAAMQRGWRVLRLER